MKLTFYRPPIGANFGDELNVWLWPKLLGHLLDEDERELFIGIGSIINDKYPKNARKIVMGAGYGSYDPAPVIDETWDVRFVRGPQTAQHLGLGSDKVITDGAVLVRTVVGQGAKKRFRMSYIPHWESLDLGDWQSACRMAGLHLIDPRGPVEHVLSDIAGSEVVMAEAMHGVIVADALRIPWIPVLPTGWHHRFKWTDWTRSVGVDYKPRRVLPAGTAEWRRLVGQRRQKSNGRPPGAADRSGQARLTTTLETSESPGWERLKGRSLAALAAASLWRSARAEPMLSADSKIEELTFQAQHQVEVLRRSRCACL